MTRPDRASYAGTAPIDELLTVLLRQFRRPLAAHGVALSDADIQARVAALLSSHLPDDQRASLCAALVAVVAESEAVLSQWNLTFEQALVTEMGDMPGWETTAEFLDIANEKANAELRIAGGAALTTAFGDLRYTPYLFHLAARDDDDMDTIIARRVLTFVSGVEPTTPDWLAQARVRLDPN